MAAQFGVVEPFDLKGGEDVSEYFERLEFYFEANNITEAKRKHAVFLSVVGKDAYHLIRSLCAPQPLNGKSYIQIKILFKDHLPQNPM